MKKISDHNLFNLEEIKNDLSVATLQLSLVFEYIGNHGFSNKSDTLLGLALSMVRDQSFALEILFECIDDGREMNPESHENDFALVAG